MTQNHPLLHVAVRQYQAVTLTQQEGSTQAAPGLPALLEGLQLTPDEAARSLPDACVAHCLAAEPSQKAVFTFVDAVLPCPSW